MTRTPIPLLIEDTAAFARALGAALPAAPGHQEMLSHLARAGGYRNWQALRASAEPRADEPAPDERLLKEALRLFDGAGLWLRWPLKTSRQRLCLWTMWDLLPARREMTEPEVNAVLDGGHAFGDRALLRRALIEHRMASRERDGSAYRRVETAPEPTARALIRVIRARRAAA